MALKNSFYHKNDLSLNIKNNLNQNIDNAYEKTRIKRKQLK